jgi:hypothetical protein
MNDVASCEKLSGTWKLIEVRGDITATFGKSPHGLFTFSRDGRTLVLITSEKRPKIPDPARMTDQERVDLFKTMLAYGGTYTFDGKELKIKVDISWNENWSGTEQVRFAKLEGNRLELSTPLYPSTVDGKPTITVLIWEKLT